MSFLPTAEQSSLRAAARDLFAAHAGPDARRAYVDQGADHAPKLWTLMAELGLHGILISEGHGGAGGTLLDLAMVLEEAGSTLLCSPFFATAVLATTAVTSTGDEEAMTRILPSFARGECVASLAFRTPKHADSSAVVATRVRDGYRLNGRAIQVVDGCAADQLVVLASSDYGSGLFVTEGRQSWQATDSAALDPTRRLADVEFTDAPATLIGSPSDGAASLDRALSVAQVATAAEQVGAAQRCLDMAIEYTKNRSQFSRPIASFQAVKHECADMFVDVQSARSVALHAAWAFTADPTVFESAVHLAAALVSEAFYRTAAQNIQLHGAIGFTWEHDAHLYLKRAISSARLLGTPEQHREATAVRVGL